MPEGPEIKRAADQIAQAIAHRPITEIFFAFDHLKPYESILKEQEIVAVESKGKAMLIRFGNQLSIYSHNQLYGKWMIRPAYAYPATNRQLRLAIHNQKKSALLYSASDIAVLDPVAVALHPFLNRLGPDVLDESISLDTVIERFQDSRFRRQGLASLLLNQQFLCGLGNYLRSEVLFVAKVYPRNRPIDCTPEQIQQLAQAAIAVTYQSYKFKGVTNDLQFAAQLKQQGKPYRDYRHYVFGREGKPCFICRSTIIKEMLAGRRLYYCETCQQKRN